MHETRDCLKHKIIASIYSVNWHVRYISADDAIYTVKFLHKSCQETAYEYGSNMIWFYFFYLFGFELTSPIRYPLHVLRPTLQFLAGTWKGFEHRWVLVGIYSLLGKHFASFLLRQSQSSMSDLIRYMIECYKSGYRCRESIDSIYRLAIRHLLNNH